MTIGESIRHALQLGPLTPTTLASVLTDIGHSPAAAQQRLRAGLDRGEWHLDADMKIAISGEVAA